ncbi:MULTISPECIES: serine/threonine protein kinase [Gammaproteobacteria]|uniref:serine/threonine protein kinase n=1 Tax=Gammaproteobacteria TaxID=1236 RepID=UPI000DD0C184|nr:MULTISPECIES: serine/threonine protein kinase [Gammaproteobacteria]RTE86761.1 serine/threonine protein kinase [Aliidiomarina sp. B3213]TCZ90685.1 serine/threonine protein kinase [Lysobacter sp. N42]
MSDFTFSSLSPELILDALESVGYYPSSGLLALNSYENRVYQFLNDGGQRYVVKFYRPARWSNAQIQEEHDFLSELHDVDIPVVQPIRENGVSLFEYQGYRFSVFPSVGGRALESDNLDHLDELGRQLGRMHQVAKVKQFQQRPTLIDKAILKDIQETLLACPLMPDSLRTAFEAILQPVVKQLLEIEWERYDTIRLHGDCHVGNLLVRDDGLTFVDFDDARQGPAIQDLWMMLSGDRQQQTLQLDTLVSAYEEFTSFDASQLRLIEPLRSFRIIQYMAWLAKRWGDPAFTFSFAWFAEARYWEQQILALKEQLANMQEPPLRLQP